MESQCCDCGQAIEDKGPKCLVAQYKDDLVSAGIEKAKQRQAMFAVLTPEQQAELKAQREEGRKLRDLLRS